MPVSGRWTLRPSPVGTVHSSMAETLRCPSCGFVGDRTSEFVCYSWRYGYFECPHCKRICQTRRFRTVRLDEAHQARLRQSRADEDEQRRPWWDKEPGVDPSVGPWPLRLAPAADLLAERDAALSVTKIERRLEKAYLRLADQVQAGYEIESSLMIPHPVMNTFDWAITTEGGHWTMSAFGGASYLQSVTAGYLVGRVTFATSKQRHHCRVSRGDFRSLAMAAHAGELWSQSLRGMKYLDERAGIDSRIPREVHRPLARLGLSIAIADVAAHHDRACEDAPIVGLDHASTR